MLRLIVCSGLCFVTLTLVLVLFCLYCNGSFLVNTVLHDPNSLYVVVGS